MITNGTCVQKVPSNHPQDLWVICRLEGMGAGGSWTLPLNASVNGHQMSRITTMTVVICIIRRALPLDSGTPLILLHQKYAVTATLKKTENQFGSVRQVWCAVSLTSFSSLPRYCPAATTLIGPVRM